MRAPRRARRPARRHARGPGPGERADRGRPRSGRAPDRARAQRRRGLELQAAPRGPRARAPPLRGGGDQAARPRAGPGGRGPEAAAAQAARGPPNASGPARKSATVPDVPGVLTADTAYGSAHSFGWGERTGFEIHAPVIDTRDGTGRRPPKDAFRHDPQEDGHTCRQGKTLRPARRHRERRATGGHDGPSAASHPAGTARAARSGRVAPRAGPGPSGGRRTRTRATAPGPASGRWASSVRGGSDCASNASSRTSRTATDRAACGCEGGAAPTSSSPSPPPPGTSGRWPG